jgi:hypothetical protein
MSMELLRYGYPSMLGHRYRSGLALLLLPSLLLVGVFSYYPAFRLRSAAAPPAPRRVAALGPWLLPVGTRDDRPGLGKGRRLIHIPGRASAERRRQRPHPQGATSSRARR